MALLILADVLQAKASRQAEKKLDHMAACEPYSGLKESYSACFCLTQCARFISKTEVIL